jgi:1-acyl-sn-glycerol-3-phosphate acyltransferase
VRTILLVLLYAIITVLIVIPLVVFFPFGIREPLMAVGKWAMSLGLWVLGIQVEVSGREVVDKKASYIFMANHVSFIDGPMLYRLIPQAVRVIIKKSIFRIPVIGQGMKFVGFVPVDRKRARGGKRSIERAAALMRERGYSYLLFPEGTRSRDGRIKDFRRGGFFLALESGAPIVPISITGTFELMPKGSLFVRPGRVRVQFHPPISTGGCRPENMRELMARVKGAIESGLPAAASSQQTGPA